MEMNETGIKLVTWLEDNGYRDLQKTQEYEKTKQYICHLPESPILNVYNSDISMVDSLYREFGIVPKSAIYLDSDEYGFDYWF